MLLLNQPDLKKIENQAQTMTGVISLAQGALRIGGVSQIIKDFVSDVLKTDKADYYSYSLGMNSLREKIAQHLSTVHARNLAAENIVVTHGAINGIAALCLMLLNSEDEVLIPQPTYPPYFNAVALAKGKVKLVPAYHFSPQGWTFDLDMVKASVTSKTKMIIIAHPSNPCGVCLTAQELVELSQWCQENKIYCLVDEAYDNYFFDVPAVSSTPLVIEHDYVIRIGSFSKTFGMSGWRLGYVVAPKHIVRHMAGVQDGLIVCPSVVAQYAALSALNNILRAADYTAIIQANRDLAFSLLSPLIEEGYFSCALPAAGFFLFLKTMATDTTFSAQKILETSGVALVPGKDFGPSGKSFMRLCFARDAQTLKDAITRLCEIKNKSEIFR